MKTYHESVTRIEAFTVSEGDLAKERLFQKGKSDRKTGLPCSSNDGAYLNGWYAEVSTIYYYIPAAAAHHL